MADIMEHDVQDSSITSIEKARGAPNFFTRLASRSALMLGSTTAFVVATGLTLVWALSGPFFNYSDTWQLVINTATTVLTFLAVFLIQHTQNREGKAIQLKLDELISCSKSARNRLINLEHCSDEELKELEEEFARRRRKVNAAMAAE